MNHALNLLLLAFEAHASAQFESAGTLFAAALASDDKEELVKILNAAGGDQATAAAGPASGHDGRQSLSQIASSMALAMAEDANSSSESSGDDEDDDEDEVGEDEPDEDEEDADPEDDEDPEDVESEEDSEEPEDDEDEEVIPSSISSSAAAAAHSPVKLKIKLS